MGVSDFHISTLPQVRAPAAPLFPFWVLITFPWKTASQRPSERPLAHDLPPSPHPPTLHYGQASRGEKCARNSTGTCIRLWALDEEVWELWLRDLLPQQSLKTHRQTEALYRKKMLRSCLTWEGPNFPLLPWASLSGRLSPAPAAPAALQSGSSAASPLKEQGLAAALEPPPFRGKIGLTPQLTGHGEDHGAHKGGALLRWKGWVQGFLLPSLRIPIPYLPAPGSLPFTQSCTAVCSFSR